MWSSAIWRTPGISISKSWAILTEHYRFLKRKPMRVILNNRIRNYETFLEASLGLGCERVRVKKLLLNPVAQVFVLLSALGIWKAQKGIVRVTGILDDAPSLTEATCQEDGLDGWKWWACDGSDCVYHSTDSSRHEQGIYQLDLDSSLPNNFYFTSVDVGVLNFHKSPRKHNFIIIIFLIAASV